MNEIILPDWADMPDLDKGAALLHLHKVNWEGREYAMSDYPCRYFVHPDLTVLSPELACRHAQSMEVQAQALTLAEYERLYDAALDHVRAERP
jgi:hypothetical protein